MTEVKIEKNVIAIESNGNKLGLTFGEVNSSEDVKIINIPTFWQFGKEDLLEIITSHSRIKVTQPKGEKNHHNSFSALDKFELMEGIDWDEEKDLNGWLFHSQNHLSGFYAKMNKEFDSIAIIKKCSLKTGKKFTLHYPLRIHYLIHFSKANCLLMVIKRYLLDYSNPKKKRFGMKLKS